MPLNGFDSLCEERQKIIVSRDRGQQREHRANNINFNRVMHYRIDDEVISDVNKNKCDFLLMNEDKHTAYLIELKGSDLTKAVIQLESTELALKDELRGYDLQFRIVASKARTHSIESVTFKRFKQEKKSTLKYQTNLIEELI